MVSHTHIDAGTVIFTSRNEFEALCTVFESSSKANWVLLGVKFIVGSGANTNSSQGSANQKQIQFVWNKNQILYIRSLVQDQMNQSTTPILTLYSVLRKFNILSFANAVMP